jgi:osmotically-inducible protein OsmY
MPMLTTSQILRLLMTLLLLSGIGAVSTACVLSAIPAAIGVGAAAVTAGSTEKGLGTSISDSAIKAKINESFFHEDHSLYSSVSVTVNQGSILLTGNVKLPEHKIKATQLSWEVRGVVEVINEIEVRDKSSLKDAAKDFAAAAQLRTKLIGDSEITSFNFSIDVVNGTVYLAGIASGEAEMQAVIGHARSLRFAREVVNYINISDDDRQ